MAVRVKEMVRDPPSICAHRCKRICQFCQHRRASLSCRAALDREHAIPPCAQCPNAAPMIKEGTQGRSKLPLT